jgi:hypothetical protein
MKVYIDESWDVGFKESSSDYFCFAILVTQMGGFPKNLIFIRRIWG